MKSLSIVRHAKSSWKDQRLNDFERPLNKRGERDAPKMAERIAAARPIPSKIISSPALRALTTAEVIAQQLGYPRAFIQTEPGLYLASGDQIINLIAQQDSTIDHLMIIGHNPGLTDCLNWLIPGLTENLPTAGVARIDVEGSSWDLRGNRSAELVYYDYPKKHRDRS